MTGSLFTLPKPKRGGMPDTLFSRNGPAFQKQASLPDRPKMCPQPSYRYHINHQALPNPAQLNPTHPSIPDPTDRLLEKYGVSLQFLPCPTVPSIQSHVPYPVSVAPFIGSCPSNPLFPTPKSPLNPPPRIRRPSPHHPPRPTILIPIRQHHHPRRPHPCRNRANQRRLPLHLHRRLAARRARPSPR